MRMRTVAILALIALFSTSACAAARSSSDAAPPASEGAAARSAPAAAPPAPRQAAATTAGAPANDAQQSVPSLDRMIIRTVSMTIAVQDVQDAFHKVEQLANEENGYLAGSQIRQDGDRLTATVTLRVPADSATYQATLERLRGLAERVVDEQSQAQDVTDQYVDLDARLRTLRASEESLLQLMAKAQRVEDIIAIQQQLTNVRTQIEQIQGQKEVLERRVDMATITLTIREAAAFVRPGWNPGGVFSEAFQALGQALRGLTTFAIWLAVFSPIWGGFLLLVWLFIWLIRRLVRRPSRRVVPAPAPTAPPAAPAV